jgi:uncharacterized protein HemY
MKFNKDIVLLLVILAVVVGLYLYKQNNMYEGFYQAAGLSTTTMVIIGIVAILGLVLTFFIFRGFPKSLSAPPTTFNGKPIYGK